jgi:diguanylate cyclase (GGDEF)-like protein
VDARTKAALKSLFVPGGVLLLGTALFFQTNWVTMAPSVLSFLYYSGFAAGFLLTWRFHSSRMFSALLILLLAEAAISSLASGRAPSSHALEAIAILVPLNFVLLSIAEERGFAWSNLAPTFLLLFVQSSAIAVFLRSEQSSSPMPSRALRHAVGFPFHGYVWLAFVIAGTILLVRFFIVRKPAEVALFWSLAAFLLGIRFAAGAPIAREYFAASAFILGASIIENSYLLAYHDELTTLPSRRAFNDAMLAFAPPSAIAMVDIDHFKKFNDTYGHDTGDQVLRLVASKLAGVSGGGRAYRYGGEEFAILFPGKTTEEVRDHLEELRAEIESSSFRMRGSDRRHELRGPDRRVNSARPVKRHAARHPPQLDRDAALSVTVSIGVASAQDGSSPDVVIRAADKALYRAKAAGRNRVEVASAPRRRSGAKVAGIA